MKRDNRTGKLSGELYHSRKNSKIKTTPPEFNFIIYVRGERSLLYAYRFLKIAFNAFSVCTKAGKLLFANIGEAGKYLAVNLLLIFKYSEGMEGQPPSFMLKQSNHCIPCFIVAGYPENVLRLRHTINPAIN